MLEPKFAPIEHEVASEVFEMEDNFLLPYNFQCYWLSAFQEELATEVRKVGELLSPKLEKRRVLRQNGQLEHIEGSPQEKAT